MSYTYTMPDGKTHTAGDYAKFTIFENQIATKPFSLVLNTFDLDGFFDRHPDIGGRSQNKRVMDCFCRIEVVLLDKTEKPYALLTPIIPVKTTYQLNLDAPDIFMRRVDTWGKQHRRAIRVGTFHWKKEYDDPETSLQATFKCIDVLLNQGGMTDAELADASHIVLADQSSEVDVLDSNGGVFGHVYDIRSGESPVIQIQYVQTGETQRIGIGALYRISTDHRLRNASIVKKGTNVAIFEK